MGVLALNYLGRGLSPKQNLMMIKPAGII